MENWFKTKQKIYKKLKRKIRHYWFPSRDQQNSAVVIQSILNIYVNLSLPSFVLFLIPVFLSHLTSPFPFTLLYFLDFTNYLETGKSRITLCSEPFNMACAQVRQVMASDCKIVPWCWQSGPIHLHLEGQAMDFPDLAIRLFRQPNFMSWLGGPGPGHAKLCHYVIVLTLCYLQIALQISKSKSKGSFADMKLGCEWR